MRGSLGLALITALCHLQGSLCSVNEYEILAKLLSQGKYNPDNRPVEFSNESLTITVDLALKQIISLTESTETLKVNFWLRLSWYDIHLKWDPEQYGGVKEVTIKPSKIWTPDVKLYNDASEAYDMPAYQEFYTTNVRWDGQVKWNVPYVYLTSCGLNMVYFPFDKQQCILQFGLWGYPLEKVDLKNKSDTADLKHFVCHGEWLLLGMPVKRHVDQYVDNLSFVDVTYTLIILRKPLYNVFNMIYPCLLLTATAMLVFCLPPASGDKLNLAVTVLLAQTVFLLVIAEHIPQQSDTIPLASWFFGMNIALLGITTAMTVVTMNLHHRGPISPPVPKIIKTIFFEFLGPMLLMCNYINNHKKAKKLLEGKITNIQACSCDRLQTSVANEFDRESTVIDYDVGSHTQQNGNQDCRTQGSSDSGYHFARISDMLQDFQRSRMDDQEQKLLQTEWVLLAKVTDRMLFILLFVGTAVCFFLILTKHPNYSSELPHPPIPCKSFDIY